MSSNARRKLIEASQGLSISCNLNPLSPRPFVTWVLINGRQISSKQLLSSLMISRHTGHAPDTGSSPRSSLRYGPRGGYYRSLIMPRESLNLLE